MHRVFGVVAAGLIVLAGCSSSSKADDAAAKRASDDDPSAVSSTTTRPGEKPSGPKAKSGKGSATTSTTAKAGAASGSTTTVPKYVDDGWMDRTFEISAELQEACVRPGGTQTIRVKSEPGAGVAYGATYSDGKSGLTEGHYGGNNGGFADENGEYEDTWVVAANAPPGYSEVNVLSSDPEKGHAEKILPFQVAGITGTCG